jgi:hypothetical protein
VQKTLKGPNCKKVGALEGFDGSAYWNLVSPRYRSRLLTCYAYAIIENSSSCRFHKCYSLHLKV